MAEVDHRRRLLERIDPLCDAEVGRLVFAQVGPRPLEVHTCHPFPRLTWIVSGCKHIGMSDGERALDLILPAGTAIFMPPRAWTRPRFDSRRAMIGIIFNREYTRFIWSDHDGLDQRPVVADAWYHVPMAMRGAGAHLMNALAARARDLRGREAGRLDCRLLQALVVLARDMLAREPAQDEGGAQATWETIRQFAMHHHHRDINRTTVARAFNLHPNYVSTLFVEQGREPFGRFLTRIRLERAAELLSTGTLSVEEVGRACGYAHAAYFIKAFRRFHGTTPGRFARAGSTRGR